MKKRNRMQQQSNRRDIFLRYLGEVSEAVSSINKTDQKKLYDKLLKVAKRQTAAADAKLDDRGRVITEDQQNFGDNVLIVDPEERMQRLRDGLRTNDDSDPDDETTAETSSITKRKKKKKAVKKKVKKKAVKKKVKKKKVKKRRQRKLF